jgi:hypothetical protein
MDSPTLVVMPKMNILVDISYLFISDVIERAKFSTNLCLIFPFQDVLIFFK